MSYAFYQVKVDVIAAFQGLVNILTQKIQQYPTLAIQNSPSRTLPNQHNICLKFTLSQSSYVSKTTFVIWELSGELMEAISSPMPSTESTHMPYQGSQTADSGFRKTMLALD